MLSVSFPAEILIESKSIEMLTLVYEIMSQKIPTDLTTSDSTSGRHNLILSLYRPVSGRQR